MIPPLTSSYPYNEIDFVDNFSISIFHQQIIVAEEIRVAQP